MSFAIGSSPIPVHRFVILDAVSSVAWATVTVVGGYLAGQALGIDVGDVRLVVLAIGGIVILLVSVRILAGYLWSRRRREEQPPTPQQ
ncbi:MAG: hypothetical protein ACYS9X_24610 [Planctomycetota bacterium]|jgi:membrane protein DedA with SNARE-associated domain